MTPYVGPLQERQKRYRDLFILTVSRQILPIALFPWIWLLCLRTLTHDLFTTLPFIRHHHSRILIYTTNLQRCSLWWELNRPTQTTFCVGEAWLRTGIPETKSSVLSWTGIRYAPHARMKKIPSNLVPYTIHVHFQRFIRNRCSGTSFNYIWELNSLDSVFSPFRPRLH